MFLGSLGSQINDQEVSLQKTVVDRSFRFWSWARGGPRIGFLGFGTQTALRGSLFFCHPSWASCSPLNASSAVCEYRSLMGEWVSARSHQRLVAILYRATPRLDLVTIGLIALWKQGVVAGI